MKKWIPNSKAIQFVALIAAVSVLLYAGSLFVVLREIKKIENLNKEMNAVILKKEQSEAIKTIIETNKEDIRHLRDFYVQKGDEIQFIEHIEGVAKKSGILFEINSIDVKASQTNSFKEDIVVKISIAGWWNNIIMFADMIEKMPFGALVQNISLNTEEKKWTGQVEFLIYKEK